MRAKENQTSRQFLVSEHALGSFSEEQQRGGFVKGRQAIPQTQAHKWLRQLQNSWHGCVLLAVLALVLVVLSGCAGLVSGTSTNLPPSTLSITNVQTTSLTTSTSQIVWTTNVPADSAVAFGTTPYYGTSTPVDSTMVTSHQMTLSGLSAGTTYYYQVSSTDSKNNNGKSGGHKFATAGFNISGTITPAQGGNGATVTLSGALSATTTTNSSGAYAFTGLPSGSYAITPTNAGYTFTPANQNVTVGTTNLTGVNFTANGAATAPTISTQPGNQTVTAGQTATFTVVASGTAPLSYQWQKNGANIAGATASSYTTLATTTADSGSTFDVVVNNSAGTATSSAATLTVNAAPVAPAIGTQPGNQTVTAGQTATFTVAASGTAPLSYQWQKNGANIAGATSSSYTTPATTTADNGSTFDVVVNNSAGTATSSAATLTVNAAPVAPTISTQPANQTVTAGQTATFTVVASGTAPLSYQWQKNGANIAGATASSYTTLATTTADSGSTFDVVVSNTAGIATSNAATLTVNAAPVAPTISTQPANQTVTAGQTATFTVAATGTTPLSYQWQKNGANIAGATASSYATPATTMADTGSTFDVVVNNSAGTATSNAATLTVNAAPVAPTISTQPGNQTVTAGQTATFTVTATGTAPLSYQWQKNGANIAGATASSYATPATTTADSGSTFDVVVTNSAGTATSSTATLTVNAAAVAPTITTQPANQTVTAGQTATFTLVASGTAPLSYQWQKNGANISGATSSSYTTPATTTSDSGSTFNVVVSNSAGTATSTAATLTVNPAPVAPAITTQPANQTVTAGQTATFAVVATGTAPLSYQWQKNGANIAGATSSSYTTPATTAADSGSTFDVVVSNSAGTVTSTAATLTVNAPAIQVNPVNFGNVVVGTSVSQALIISNTGTSTLTITQMTVTGATFIASGYTLPLSVNAGQQTTITVAFLPTAVGTVSGSVSIVSNASTSPTSVGLSGSGIAATFTLGISPTSLSFGNVNVGSSSSQNVTVTNTGNSNVTISGFTTAGAGFSASGVNANTVLTPSQSATLTVSFAPTATGSVIGSVSVLSNATNSPSIATLSGSGVSSTSLLPTCGKLNDTNVYLPPNYDTFTPPAKGQSYIDPVFGCKITRITDAIAMGWVSANHFYTTVTPFNADDTYLLVFNGNAGGPDMVVDMSGNTVVSSANMPGSNSAIRVWDTTDPKVFYYTSGNQFLKGTITGTPPNATVAATVLATFLQYTSTVIPGDMDISNDGLHIWLTSAPDMGGGQYTADVFLVTLNAGNGAATSAALGTVMPSVSYHKLQIVPNNGVSVEGTPRTIYNPNGTVYEVPGGGTSDHTDWSLDGSGKMVGVARWYEGTTQNGCPGQWGFGLLDLASNAVRLCLYNNTISGSHFSARDMQSQKWTVLSNDGYGSCPSSSFYCFNNPTNMTGWVLYDGEISIWDTSGNTVRLAHHRSRASEQYWSQTRASVSRTGRYVVFDSNYNQSGTSGGVNYTDVYVLGPLY
jgi:HYDIN/CFA65/VesB family protein/Ig-like domain-containing protein/SdrD B-like protein/immunoglobulin I-set domain protein